jgi:predicted regulator of Ras-like GTPase activity (Roadblock/LC7/MglB family)
VDRKYVIVPVEGKTVLLRAGAEKICALLNEKAGRVSFVCAKRDNEWGVYVADKDGLASVRVHLNDIDMEGI